MVSIVLVTFNRAIRLEKSIVDILNQTYKNFELIICDDSSTDGTEKVCRAYEKKDSRIKYLRQVNNKGMPANLNDGLKLAKMPYIGILHDGDRFKSNLIEEWISAIESSKKIGLVFNPYIEIDQDEKVVNEIIEFENGPVSGKYLLRKKFFRNWNFSSPIYGQVFFRKSFIEKFGYFNDRYEFYADVDFWMQILHEHDAFYCIDTAIYFPSKSIQPRLFDDSILKTYFIVYDFNLKHRLIEFKKDPLRLLIELIIFYCYAIFKFVVNIRSIVKYDEYSSYKKIFMYVSSKNKLFIPLTLSYFIFKVEHLLKKIK